MLHKQRREMTNKNAANSVSETNNLTRRYKHPWALPTAGVFYLAIKKKGENSFAWGRRKSTISFPWEHEKWVRTTKQRQIKVGLKTLIRDFLGRNDQALFPPAPAAVIPPKRRRAGLRMTMTPDKTSEQHALSLVIAASGYKCLQNEK